MAYWVNVYESSGAGSLSWAG